jgi:hypothetical protein
LILFLEPIMISRQPSLRVAILRNYDTPAQWGKDMVESWRTSIQAIRPDSEIEVFHPITDGVFPNANEFDLIILTGGVFNLILPDLDPWVAKTLDFVRDTASLPSGPKIAGICWGHQAICRAMGGKIGWNAQGDVVRTTCDTFYLICCLTVGATRSVCRNSVVPQKESNSSASVKEQVHQIPW